MSIVRLSQAQSCRLSEVPDLRIGVLEAGIDKISTDPTLSVAGTFANLVYK